MSQIKTRRRTGQTYVVTNVLTYSAVYLSDDGAECENDLAGLT